MMFGVIRTFSSWFFRSSTREIVAGAIAWRGTTTSRWQFVTICFITGLVERMAMCSCNRPYDYVMHISSRKNTFLRR